METAEKSSKKSSKGMIVALLFIILAAASLFYWRKILYPEKKYKEAMELYNAGQNEEALEIFGMLDDYEYASYENNDERFNNNHIINNE